MLYQHNENITITHENYKYVIECKKQLVYHITNLFNDLNIRFVIAHGNLIEYERNEPIYNDDDVDVRFCVEDIEKWKKYCENNEKDNAKYNLIFDNRFNDIDNQLYDGIQGYLITFNNKDNIKTFNDIKVGIDVVPSIVDKKVWRDYNIDFNNLRKIDYIGVCTYVPSKEDTIKLLTSQYGKRYIIPDRIQRI